MTNGDYIRSLSDEELKYLLIYMDDPSGATSDFRCVVDIERGIKEKLWVLKNFETNKPVIWPSLNDEAAFRWFFNLLPQQGELSFEESLDKIGQWLKEEVKEPCIHNLEKEVKDE